MSLTIWIPAYNEEKNIAVIITQLKEITDKIIENLGDTLSGSNTLLNKEVWSNVAGYLDEYKTNGEDVTFCRKLVI